MPAEPEKAERRRPSVCGNAFSLRGLAEGKEVSVIPVKNKRKNSSERRRQTAGFGHVNGKKRALRPRRQTANPKGGRSYLKT